MLVELDPLLPGGVPVFLGRPEFAALVEESDVVVDDVLVDDGDVAAGGLDVSGGRAGLRRCGWAGRC